MDESAQVVPGTGTVQIDFARHTMRFCHDDELTTTSYYRLPIDVIEGGSIIAEESATKRASVIGVMDLSNHSNVSYTSGTTAIDPVACDYGIEYRATRLRHRSYLCRGLRRTLTLNSKMRTSETACDGKILGGCTAFLRTYSNGASFVSVEQTLRNLENEKPDGTPLSRALGGHAPRGQRNQAGYR